MEIFGKTVNDLESLTVFAKSSSQKSGLVSDTCYKIVVRKFPIVKLKQKKSFIFFGGIKREHWKVMC